MNIIVTGATGLVGAEVIREAIKDDGISSITALARRPLTIPAHPKLNTVIHKEFMNYSGLEKLFAMNDACLWCLGISQSQVSREEYHVITYDYTIAAAKAMLKANPVMTFMFLSGEGADTTEQSKTLFARVKGKAENELQRMPFKSLFLIRPAAIRPVHPNPNAPFIYKLFKPLFPVMELLRPSYVINSVQLAKAMLEIAKTRPQQVLFQNPQLKEIARRL
jgi:uncharacterized protein YbjT (DUF2867 family)